jgi:nucleotide-binding universal stress UspA family protein
MTSASPIVIAYDGSVFARAAVRQAGVLFTSHPAIILTVWEPGLAEFMLVSDPTGMGTTMLPYDPAVVREIEQASEKHAKNIARDGEALARSVGLSPQARVVEDIGDTAGAIVREATELDALAIVVGSRGLKGLKSKLLGSTSHGVLDKSRCPVVVVRDPGDHTD